MPRGEGPVMVLGVNKHSAPPPKAGCGFPVAPSLHTRWGAGVGKGDVYSQARSPRSRCWGPAPPAGSGVSWSNSSGMTGHQGQGLPGPALDCLLPGPA